MEALQVAAVPVEVGEQQTLAAAVVVFTHQARAVEAV
jgi:hypothetical protein